MNNDTPYKKKDKYILYEPISTNFIISMETFIKTSSEISTCLRKKHEQIFKSSWYIAWFEGNKEVFRQKMLNTTEFKRQEEKFLLDMSDMILSFGFAGFYYVKDIYKWIDKHTKTYFKRLPFGFIKLKPLSCSSDGSNGGGTTSDSQFVGQYYRKRNLREMEGEDKIKFICPDAHINRKYKFKVINDHAEFINLKTGIEAISNMSNYGNMNNNINGCTYAGGSFYTCSSSTQNLSIIPISPFYNLYQDKSRIVEAILYEG